MIDHYNGNDGNDGDVKVVMMMVVVMLVWYLPLKFLFRPDGSALSVLSYLLI